MSNGRNGGGAGSRTPVRREDSQNFYVPSLPFEVHTGKLRQTGCASCYPKWTPACGRNSQASLRNRGMLSHLTRRSQCLRWAKNKENGLLNLIKQPVRSCSWHLIVYRFFNVDTETTIRSSELPHPRRIQITPIENETEELRDSPGNSSQQYTNLDQHTQRSEAAF